MSGTSLDGIDLVAARFEDEQPQILASKSYQLPPPVKQQILTLCISSDDEIEKLGHLDALLGKLFGESCQQFISEHSVLFKAEQIAAIGLHGQTIRHRPANAPRHNFTLQIGDANWVSEITGITTIADFRRRDVAAGGQGAPLVPAFHQAIFTHKNTDRVIINIGGMANISLLHSDAQSSLIGFDTGPGNVLMDAWINDQKDLAYDKEGNWAALGTVDDDLLQSFLSLDYFSQPVPKSTGREQFNLEWIQLCLSQQNSTLAAKDVQATLLELTAQSISNEINRLALTQYEVFVCGGGAHNTQLMHRLKVLLDNATCVSNTQELQLHPDWVEATAFAWLAKQTLAGLTSNCPSVTGAKGNRILGAIFQA